MGDFISALTSGDTAINATNMWANVTSLAGFLGTVALFSFGLYELRKLVKGASKGKVRF